MRSKKCARAKADKENYVVQKIPKSHVKRGQLLVLQHYQQQKSPKQHANTTTRVLDPKSVQSAPKPREGDAKIYKDRPECHHQSLLQ